MFCLLLPCSASIISLTSLFALAQVLKLLHLICEAAALSFVPNTRTIVHTLQLVRAREHRMTQISDTSPASCSRLLDLGLLIVSES